MKIRGGIRIDGIYESWPSAQLCFDTSRLVLRYRGERVFRKEEIKKIEFLRGVFTTEIRIEHSSDLADSPIRFFPLFAKDAYRFACGCGLPCEQRKASFYTKGDIHVDVG